MILFFLLALGTTGLSTTVGGDALFELARPAQTSALSGVDLALPFAFSNPAALGFREGWELISTYLSPFGAGHFGHFALCVPGAAAEAFLFYAGGIAPGLSFRAEGGALSLGLALGTLGLGGRVRVLHAAQPEEDVAAALDLGFLWRGFLWLGGVAKNVWSQQAFPYEPWPLDFSGAAVLPVRLFSLSLYFGAAFQDVLTLPRYACALALDLGVLSVAASLGSTGLTLGGGLFWSSFHLEWAFLSHPHLGLSFRVSLALRWL